MPPPFPPTHIVSHDAEGRQRAGVLVNDQRNAFVEGHVIDGGGLGALGEQLDVVVAELERR